MAKGASKIASGGGGVKSAEYFGQSTSEQVALFRSAMSPALNSAFRDYATGMVGGNQKAAFDDQHGLSDFIDSHSADPLRVKDNPTLYRGGTISDEQFQALQVGKPLSIMDSQGQLTSWSTRELAAHMYAEESSLTWGQGGKKPHDVIVVDQSKTRDAIVMPYTYPQNEVLRSKRKSYTITKIVDESQYNGPIGRGSDSTDYYTKPVTYIYVKSK